MPTIAVNGTELAYDVHGAGHGPTLLLSHSLFFDRTMFEPVVALLPPSYRVVAYDHRGQGGSAPAPLEEQDMDVLAEDAAALVEALELGPVHVVGNSMGGFVALRLAVRRPDLVRSAVAMSSSAEIEHSLEAFAPLVDAFRAHGPAPVLDTLVHIMFGDTSIDDRTPELVEWRARMAALPVSIADSAHQVIHRQGIVDELAAVTVPVLAIAGAEDHAYPPPTSSDNIAVASGGRAVVVERAGHSVALEQPRRVADLLVEHVTGVEA